MKINPDNFIFHSDLIPYKVAQRIDLTVQSGTSIAASNDAKYGRKVYYYSDWVDIGYPDAAVEAYYRSPAGTVRKGWVDHRTGSPAVTARSFMQQSDDNKIRLIMEITNFNNVTVNYPRFSFQAYVYVYS